MTCPIYLFRHILFKFCMTPVANPIFLRTFCSTDTSSLILSPRWMNCIWTTSILFEEKRRVGMLLILITNHIHNSVLFSDGTFGNTTSLLVVRPVNAVDGASVTSRVLTPQNWSQVTSDLTYYGWASWTSTNYEQSFHFKCMIMCVQVLKQEKFEVILCLA